MPIPADTPAHAVAALPVWLDLVAMALNGMLGGAVARSRGFPVVGTLLAGVLLGGGMLRDVLLGHEAVALANWYYLPPVLVMALVGAFLSRHLTNGHPAVVVLRAVILGLLVTIGAQVALSSGAPLITAMLLGVVTASAGGVVVDAMSNQRSAIARTDQHWFASALAVDAVVFVLVSFYLDFWLAVVLGTAAGAALHAVSTIRGWPSPLWPEQRRGARVARTD